jgi:cytochrome c
MQKSRNNIRLRTSTPDAKNTKAKRDDGLFSVGFREDEVITLFTTLVVSLLLVAVGPTAAQDPTAAGDPAAGALVFKKCMACHQVGPDAKNGIAPVLNGVVGRKAGQYPGYSYSPANKKSGLTWDEQTLARYLRAPSNVVPGTKMIFAGLTKDREISGVIAYLKQFAPDGKQISP